MILHAVLRHDGSETRRRDGAVVPILELGPVLADLPATAGIETVDWTRFGEGVCAPELARHQPEQIRTILRRLGDARLAAKAARLQARLTDDPPAEVLYQELWDGFGFSANREPMRALASLLPLAALEDAMATVPAARRPALARGLLFGAGGFLPLSPVDAVFAQLDPGQVREVEAYWSSHGGPWHGHHLLPTAWTRARVRPANHPATRLAAAAMLVAAAPGGLAGALLGPLRAESDPVVTLRALASAGNSPGLGPDRAASLVANALLPFALALGEQTGDVEISDAASRAWERLAAAEPNDAVRRAQRQVAGDARLGRLGGRGQQGLLHLDATLCAPRRCFECPIAHRVLAEDGASPFGGTAAG